jgi:PAS domain S-box-containing protein
LFLRRLLSSLSEDGLIRFDSATHSWTWDIGDIGAKAPADNVADLLANTIARLPAAERDVLQIAACLGNRFDVATLALVVGRAKQEVEELLRATVTGQYVTQHDLVYEFVHDQVQQASYMLIDEASRAVRHLEIGRLLLADTDDTDLEERIFDIATHYNLGAHLLTDPAERLELVRLNLVAGRKARLAAAFAASAAYLKQGLSLLGEGAWRDHYCLTLDVHSELIQVSDLNIQYEEVEALFDVITEKAKQDVDAGVAHQTLIMSCIARHELGRAISLAERYLERLDVTLENERESDLTIAELYELPRMENREKLAATEILTAISTPVILSAPERFPSVVYTMLNLISRYGNNSMSSFAYSQYAMVLCLMQRYEEGNRFGQLAVDLLEKYSHPGRAAEIMNMQYANVRHWMQPVHEQITPLKTYHRMAMQAGSFEFAFYCLLNYLWLSWGSGKPLEHCLVEVEPSIGLCQSKNQRFSLLMSLLLAQMVLNLTGRSPSTTQLEGKWFSEDTMMSRLEGNHFLLATYGLLKMKLCYLFGDPGAAYRQTRDVLKYRASLNPHYLYTKSTFYGALSCIAGLPDGESDADRQERLANLGLFEEELKLWAESAPMNYQHQYDLVMAEKSRVSDKHWEATQLYEKAIKGAQENQFAHDQALANELFGRFWLEQGNNRIAEMYLREARALYHQWGASAKVTHLEDSYPRWFKTGTAPKEQPDTTGRIFTTITQPITSIQLDLESITSASQLLAAETDLDQLCTKMISLVMANSGAEKGVLLLKQENEWFVQARKDITTDEHTALFHQPFDPTDRETELIPESVFNYCQRTKDVLVLGDAQLDQRFAEDRMIKNEIRSIACLPALSQGEVRALLYLENSQTAEVFTLENVGLLKHLSAQFAVSVENALLYANLSQLVEERTAHLQNEIEERKQAEEALQQSEEMYRDLVERISDVIYAVDTGGVITYLNPAIEALIGLPPEQVVGQPFAQFIHPEDLGRLQGNVQDLLAGTVPGTAEYRVLNASGETRWIRVTSQPIVDGDQVTSMQGLLTDITERKRIEEQLEEAATAAERQRLARELHDSVTQSLFSLDLFANATEQALATGRIERATENTRYICDLSQRALADMRLLIFELRPPVLEQEGLVGALRARLAAVEARAGLETEFNQTAVRPLPPAVESELYAVAREALNNTLKHARAEGVTVYLEFDEQSCCLTIADDGIGFDLEGAELGAGYGLRGMRERVESIDGRLTLETSPGRGASVRVEVTV